MTGFISYWILREAKNTVQPQKITRQISSIWYLKTVNYKLKTNFFLKNHHFFLFQEIILFFLKILLGYTKTLMKNTQRIFFSQFAKKKKKNNGT